MSNGWQRMLPGFIAGAVGVLTFHQGIIGTLHTLHLIPFGPFPGGPVGPLHVPYVFDLAFWGGCWGTLFALLAPRFRGPGWLPGVGLGIVATLTDWFLVAPLKGAPLAHGQHLRQLLPLLVINAFWGLGVALIYAALSGQRRAARP